MSNAAFTGMPVNIRPATDADMPAILSVHQAAFPDEPVADLTAALLVDPSARPLTSLVAWAGDEPAGHILFTAARLRPATAQRAAILAPLAVLPARQRHGIGSALVTEGLAVLARSGVSLVFVLGHPAYYPRFGFSPAGARGFTAPYPIPEKHAEAWMVLSLDPPWTAPSAGTVMCAQALDRPEHWRE